MIHPAAIVSSNAKIADSVEIGPFAIVEDDVEIGEGSTIRPHAILRNGTRLGKAVTIDSHAVIAGLPQDLKFDARTVTYVRIGDNTVVREGSTLNRATKADSATFVGSDCYLMAVTHLGHDCRIGDRVVIGNNSLLGGWVEVGDDTFLGGDSGIHQFCRIGAGAMFGGDSTSTVDVPPYCVLAERNTLFGLNVVGLRRRGHPREAIAALKRSYKEIFSAPGKTREKAKSLLEGPDGAFPETRLFLEFFQSGKRGFAWPAVSAKANSAE